MSSAICFKMDQSKMLTPGNGLKFCSRPVRKENRLVSLPKIEYFHLKHYKTAKNKQMYCSDRLILGSGKKPWSVEFVFKIKGK